MGKFVVDASVVLKWIPGKMEEGVETARKVYEMAVAEKCELWAPDLLLIESLNILVNKRKVKVNLAVKGMQMIGRIVKLEYFDKENIGELQKLMENYKISAYDGLYVYLAMKLGCKLVTVDKKLLGIKGLAVRPEDVIE
jgi:predicted nucleic acid-binding protein